jgi:hypothetical protein
MAEGFIEKVDSYKCNCCKTLYNSEIKATECVFKHIQTQLANLLWQAGHNLLYINYICKFGWQLAEEQKDITKDNCFIVAYWQCCEKPAYRIVSIEDGGYLRLWGKGGWNGYYGGVINVNKLPKPHPKEELYIYS